MAETIAKLEIPTDRPPFFVGAGVIKLSSRIREYAEIPQIAAQIIGSISDDEWGGKDPSGQKKVFHWDKAHQAAYNAIGLKNPGRKAMSLFLPEDIKRVHAAGQLAIIAITSVIGEDARDKWPLMTEWALEMGADGVELNGSCPNDEPDDLLCNNTRKATEAVNLTRERVGPGPYLIFKTSPLPEVAIRTYHQLPLDVDGISAINNCRRLSPINPETGLPYIEVSDGYAGQSGPVIAGIARKAAEQWGARWCRGSQYDIWSIGGVADGYEAHHRINDLGARMVGAAQAFYRAENPANLAWEWEQQYDRTAALSDNS